MFSTRSLDRHKHPDSRIFNPGDILDKALTELASECVQGNVLFTPGTFLLFGWRADLFLPYVVNSFDDPEEEEGNDQKV